MLDYQKVLPFCVEHDLSFDELMLLYTIDIRNKNTHPELHPLMSQYYSAKSNFDTILLLEKKGMLQILSRNKTDRKLLLRNLVVTDKFSDLLFIQPDNVWHEFYKRYPAVGIFGESNAYFQANMLGADDKEYFINNILKNANKEGADQILKRVEQMFSYNEYTGKPEGYAKVGISKFLRNWDEILKTHVEKYVETRSFNRLLN